MINPFGYPYHPAGLLGRFGWLTLALAVLKTHWQPLFGPSLPGLARKPKA